MTYATLLLAAGACATEHRAARPVTLVAPPAPTLQPAPPRAPDPNDICRGRVPCTTEARHDAGISAAGNQMIVVELSFGMLMDEEAAEKEPGVRNCEQREVWLLHDGPNAPVARKLLAMCNDGYGASGRGIDELVVEPNKLVHMRDGGSAWRWSETTTARLDPPAVIREHHDGSWTLSMNHDSSTDFDLETFQGSAAQEWPECDAQGQLPSADEPEVEPFTWQSIPSLTLPPSLVTGPIAQAAAIDVAACAARSGPQDPPASASYALVMDEATGTLFAQIDDDAFGTGDRLRVWATSRDDKDGFFCWKSDRVAPLEVDLDGKIVAGASSYPGVTVEVAPGANASRRLFRVRLGSVPRLVSVGYLDADPRGRPSPIATSDIEAAKGERIHLGNVDRVDPKRAVCTLDGAKLVPRAVIPSDLDEPLIDGL